MNTRGLRSHVEEVLTRAWATFGLPLSMDFVDERREGILDPEAVLLSTILYLDEPRVLADVAVWAVAHEDLIIHQKVGALRRRVEASHAVALQRALGTPELRRLPTKMRAALGGGPSHKRRGALAEREAKLAPRDVVSRRSRMLFNRLLYGASARADVITATQLRWRPPTGIALARFVGVDASTVSRIQNDLRSCGMLRKDGSFAARTPAYPGFLVSTATLDHLPSLFDAAQVDDAGLRRAMLPDFDAPEDRLGNALIKQIRTRAT